MACKIDTGGVSKPEFESPSLNANPCEFSLKLPIPKLNIKLPSIPLPKIPLPIFNFDFSLSCSLDNPIDVTAGLKFGGGRVTCFDTDSEAKET